MPNIKDLNVALRSKDRQVKGAVDLIGGKVSELVDVVNNIDAAPAKHTHTHIDITDWDDYIDQPVKIASAVTHALITIDAGTGMTSILGPNQLSFTYNSCAYIWATQTGGYLAFGVNGATVGLTDAALSLRTDNSVYVHKYLYIGAKDGLDTMLYRQGANQLQTNSNFYVGGWLQSAGHLYLRNCVYLHNKAQTAWLAFATRNVSGAEVVFDLNFVGSIMFQPSGYKLDTLVANNKVSDSDKVDGQHASEFAAAGHNHGILGASVSWDPPSLAAGAQATTTVTVTGAAFGDFVQVSVSTDLAGMTLTAYVSAANTVTIVLLNHTTGTINMNAQTFRVRVWPQTWV
jgi:hypothetical protein